MILHIMRQEMKGAFSERLLDVLESIVCSEEEEQFMI